MSILLDVGIGLEINVLTSKFILLGYQMLGEMGCHPEICFYEIYDQVKCEFCGKDFNSKNSAGKVLVLTDHKCVEIILVSFGLVE